MKPQPHLLAIALMLTPFRGAVARPIHIFSLTEIWDMADLVAVIAPESTERTNDPMPPATDGRRSPEYYQGLNTRCRVLGVFKAKENPEGYREGGFEQGSLTVVHFAYKSEDKVGGFEMNGGHFIYFLLPPENLAAIAVQGNAVGAKTSGPELGRSAPTYLAFLKADRDRRFRPVSGDYDSAFSFRTLVDTQFGDMFFATRGVASPSAETNSASATGAGTTNLAPIPLRGPMRLVFPTNSSRTVSDPHTEAWRFPQRRPPFLAPAGVTNLALCKRVTSSLGPSFSGPLFRVTDGDKEPGDGHLVELPAGEQWVQIDLERSSQIFAVVIWHIQQRNAPVFQCVVVQTADDPQFRTNVHTLFDNDYANFLGLGAGEDKQYYEASDGKLIDAKGVQGRYVRCYSKGSNVSSLNYYTEIEVWGLSGA
jgi:hypothetical protein